MSTVLRVMKFLKNLITFKQILSSQWSKFHNSATRKPSPSEFLRKYGLVTASGANHGRHKDDLSWEQPLPLTEFVNSEVGKKTFSPFDSRISIPRQPLDVVTDGLRICQYADAGHVKPFNTYSMFPFIGTYPTKLTHPETAGLVGVTQEPGGKARFFVSVHPAYQSGFVPLQRALKYRAKRDRCSFAFDQDAGRRAVQRALQSGKTVWSYDLSDATNNFPLSLQVQWMYKSGLDMSQVSSFADLSRMPFKACQEIYDRFGIDTIEWSNGQPLGLLPSAMAFHLTHIYLLRGLEIELYGKPVNRFAVVVDDVAIWDPNLAKAYKRAMDELEVPISVGKSVVSSVAAEFLGRFITRNRIVELTSQKVCGLNNVMDYARVFGFEVLNELNMSKRKKEALKALIRLPNYWGGQSVGDGLSLDDRALDPWALLWLQNHAVSKKKVSNNYDSDLLTSRVRVLVRVVRESGAKLYPGLDDYLSSLLPRHGSRLPNVWICIPGSSIYRGKVVASSEEMMLHRPSSGVLIRKDTDFDDISNLHRCESYKQETLKKEVETNAALRSFLEAVGCSL